MGASRSITANAAVIALAIARVRGFDMLIVPDVASRFLGRN